MNDVRAGLNPVHLYGYLVKARAKLLNWVRPLSLEQYTQEFPFGLKTLRDTLVEIPQAEWTYKTDFASLDAAFPSQIEEWRC